MPAAACLPVSKQPRLSDLMREDNPAAAALIASHLEAAVRQAAYWQARFPDEDVEPRIMQALYLAAYTFKPGKGTFYFWFRHKIRGQMSNLEAARRRRAQLSAISGL